MRKWFTWSVVGIVVPGLIGVLGVIVGLSEDSQIGPVLLLISCAWIVATIWLDATTRARVWTSAATLITTVSGIWWIEDRITEKQLAQNEGTLIPAGDPSPLSICPIPPNAFTIYSGSGAFWTNARTQVIVGSEQYTLLSVQRLGDQISVNALIYDEQQTLIARIENNKFIVAPFAFHRERPDRSTLVVDDRRGVEVLNIRFANSNAVIVKTAVLYTPDGKRSVTVKNGHVLIGKMADASNNCAANGAFVFHI